MNASLAGTRLGTHELTSKLGEGGMGEVWRATDSRLKREVAIKVLPAAFTADSERLARFEREAQTLAALNHPNIAAIYGIEESSGTRALVMELVEGEDLSTRIARGPLPFEEALPIAQQIAMALEAAHEQGIVHRDLKPQNVKLRADGAVKVLDFGLAKALEPAGGSLSGADLARSPTLMRSPTLTGAPGTQLGVILGTAAYMSPEQARGGAVDARADVWAFGVVAWEMLTGRRLFEGETVSDTLAAVLRQDVDWEALPPATPPALRRLLRRCLERNPRNRLHSIADVRIVVDELLSGRGAEAPAASPAVPAAGGWRRREAVAWSLAALLAVAAAAGWLLRRPTAGVAGPPRVVRAVLPLPAGVSIELDGERAGMPSLSHDGTRVAFGARQGAGPMRIWVQDLATGAARPLPGTEEGYRPFWSPDDRHIGFFTWSHLARTPAQGGAVNRLARARDARGGTWNARGTIVFAPHQRGPLLAVPEAGGATQAVTRFPADAPNVTATHRFPQFLPDGEHFVYLERYSHYGAGSGARVLVGRLGSTEPGTVVADSATNAVYADGHLIFTRDGALVAQPFDLERLTLGGQPQTLADDLLFNVRFTYGVFSASEGGLLAFMTGRQRDLSQLVWRDRAGRRLGTVGSPGVLSGYGGIALSADGRLGAVSRIEEGSSEADIWLYDLERGTETRLARPAVDDHAPLFTRDGKVLLFGSLRDDDQVGVVVQRDLATGAESELFDTGGRYVLPMSTSADGAWLAYDLNDADNIGQYDVMVRPVAGDGASRALAGSPDDDAFGQISPDGRWLAWTSDASGHYQIYVAPFPAGGAPVQVSRAGGTQPRWNPRGGELFFKALDNTLTVVPIESASGTFAVGAPTALFQVVEFLGWTYAVAPDGERFLVREPLTEAEASPVTLLTHWPALVER